jgi:hypothetical protein
VIIWIVTDENGGLWKAFAHEEDAVEWMRKAEFAGSPVPLELQ